MPRRNNGNDGPQDGVEISRIVTTTRFDPGSALKDPGHARPSGSWGEFDPALLDDGRAPVPAFPLDVLPPFWRDWARDTAQAAGAPVDYVALALLAVVAGLGGAGVRVQASPGWQEPLVLWPALVGAASSGKSPAIASLRGMLATLAQERGGEQPEEAETARADPIADLADILAADINGALLWCDQPLDWLGRLAGASSASRTQLLHGWSPSTPPTPPRGAAIGLLACLPPDRVPQLAKLGPEFAARLLYTLPHPPPYCPLGERRAAADGEALGALRRLLNMVGTAQAPMVLALAREALPPLDAFLARLHDELAEAEGLDQAWQGKGRGTVVRLIGCLALLERSIGAAAAAESVSRKTVESAIALWRDYLRPQARAVLQLAQPDDLDNKARHVVRWLKAGRVDAFSREEIRENALGRSLNAARTDQVLYRLQAAGIVRRVPYSMPSHGGRPPNRWEVNPRLTAAGNPGNPGNLPGSG